MASYNKVILMGNLTRDPELRYTPSGTPVCAFTIAMNRKYKANEESKEETCYVDVSVWSRQGESCNQYLSKGSPVLVEGRLRQRTWETQDGQKRSKLDVWADNVTFLPRSQQTVANRPEDSAVEPPITKGGDEFPSDNDIPF